MKNRYIKVIAKRNSVYICFNLNYVNYEIDSDSIRLLKINKNLLMKKFLKIIGVILAIFIAYCVIAMLFFDSKCHNEQSLVINAPKEKVWQNVNSMKAFNTWNPWMKYDPNLVVTYKGTKLVTATLGKEMLMWMKANKKSRRLSRMRKWQRKCTLSNQWMIRRLLTYF